MQKIKKVVPYIAGTGLLVVGVCLIKKNISGRKIKFESEKIDRIDENRRQYIKLK